MSYHSIMVVLFFFFQAEDGIRDHCVTGVQTCALPISEAAEDQGVLGGVIPHRYDAAAAGLSNDSGHLDRGIGQSRSEERRVGKECRCWWGADQYRKNKAEKQGSVIHRRRVSSLGGASK